ncbi:MAG: response regulator transcription factor [Gemmatimonadota bacterium]|nr:response regulator transcription factor [Gemmatimonadota bacterium]
MPRVLVIDDDSKVSGIVRRGLALEGYTVDVAASGPEGLTIARDHTPDVAIVDVMLPGIDGYEVLRRLRNSFETLPILMLTALDAPADQVKGLEVGADDYLVKPFSLPVLAARVKALLRRTAMEHPEVLRFDDLSLDTGTRMAARGHREIVLTSTEYEVLRQFLLHPRRVLPKHFLMDRVWGYSMEGSSNVLEVYVKQLRQKLEQDGAPRLIHTFRGVGYVLRAESS